MLQAVDTVLAFSMIMLLLSLMVTTLVQMMVSILGLRGSKLRFGLRQLVGAVAPELSRADVESLADKILRHPGLAAGGSRPSVEIRPKEVLMILHQLREGEGLSQQARQSLTGLFEAPASESSKLAMSLELLRRFRSASGDEADKLVKAADDALGASREMAARIDQWFDSAMAHASERFKLNTRWITIAFAALLAIGFQVDSSGIFHQLWSTPQVRTELVLQADQITDLYQEYEELARRQAAADSAAGEAQAGAVEELKQVAGNARDTLLATDLVVFHLPSKGWDWARLPGSLLTVLLLSLGAPFWYGTIGRLVGFRSSAAGRGEAKKQAS